MPPSPANGEVLRREERETSHVADAARLHARCRNRSVGLCSVFDVGDVVFLAPVDQVVVTHLSVEMHGDDGLGVGCSCRFKPGEVNAPVVGFDVNKDGVAPASDTQVAVAM